MQVWKKRTRIKTVKLFGLGIHDFLKSTLANHYPKLKVTKDTDANFEVCGTIEAMQGKKARGNLISCIDNDSCSTAKKGSYELEDLEISFSFNRGKGDNIYFIEFEGQLSPDALYLTLKKGETGKLIDVKEFRRLKED